MLWFTGTVKKIKENRWKVAILILSSIIIFVTSINWWMTAKYSPYAYRNPSTIPENNVGLVLGTSKYNANGTLNLHFKRRMEAAATLYSMGKVKHLIVSGDNHTRYYDEPSAMREAIVTLGVPESAITLDYAGFRTLDSVVRAKEVFGQNSLTVITDDFHVHRTLFLCDSYGINAVAFSSARIPYRFSAHSRIREYGARVKAFLDVYLLYKQPRFLGEKIEIKV